MKTKPHTYRTRDRSVYSGMSTLDVLTDAGLGREQQQQQAQRALRIVNTSDEIAEEER